MKKSAKICASILQPDQLLNSKEVCQMLGECERSHRWYPEFQRNRTTGLRSENRFSLICEATRVSKIAAHPFRRVRTLSRRYARREHHQGQDCYGCFHFFLIFLNLCL